MLVIAETAGEAAVIARRLRPGARQLIVASRPATEADFHLFKATITRPRKRKAVSIDQRQKTSE